MSQLIDRLTAALPTAENSYEISSGQKVVRVTIYGGNTAKKFIFPKNDELFRAINEKRRPYLGQIGSEDAARKIEFLNDLAEAAI